MMKLRSYQNAASQSVFDYWSNGGGNPLIEMATGCHAKGTQILMHDGSIKVVEKIRVGDTLMGPDSRPRRVLALARGRERMARISPKKGAPFVVNVGHLLPLVKTARSARSDAPDCHQGGKVSVLSVSDWLEATATFRHEHKLFRCAVDFPQCPSPPVEPWVVGAFIGDGGLKYGVCLTTMDDEVSKRVERWASDLACQTRRQPKPGSLAWNLHITDSRASRSVQNRAWSALREIDLAGHGAASKFIPSAYKFGSRQTRLEVLAGLMDTDGYLDRRGQTFDYVSLSKQLAVDITFVARSLGLWATDPTPKLAMGKTYWRISISGDTSAIPTIVPRKQAAPRKQKKDPLRTGFTVEVLPEDDFYGFSLDGDHLYLTDDFIVHHNTGKSLVIADLKRALVNDFGCRVLSLVHVRELVSQNFMTLLRHWPDAPAGIYSAGLNKRDAHHKVTFASIQSVFRRANSFGRRDVIMIDEAHLVPAKGQGMYRRFLDDMQAINPELRIVGFTATPYRLDTGRLDRGEGALFDDAIFTYSIVDGINDGFLSPLVSKAGLTEIDVSNVQRRGGEFVAEQLEHAADQITEQSVAELVRFGRDRRSWLIFCAGVKHAMHVREAIRALGISCETVTGNTPHGERDAILRRFKAGEIRCLTNAQVLTTGFDAPGVDLVGFMRSTLSTSLYVQIVGRGTRLAHDKENCLILDWGGNIRRHGPVDDVAPSGASSGTGETGKVSVESVRAKVCPSCEAMVAVNAQTCKFCGHEWPIDETPKHEAEAEAEIGILSSEKVQPLQVPFVDWRFDRHEKLGSPDSLRVTYIAGLSQYSKWLAFEHGGYANHKACEWWATYGGEAPFPRTVTEALDRLDELMTPHTIIVKREGKYPDVIGQTFAPRESEAA